MRTTIDYGIYFNNNFCQIARIENSIPIIKLSDLFKDSMPLCVSLNKKKEILVGEKAFNIFKSGQFSGNVNTNTYLGFAATIGTGKKYESSNTCRSYTSEELLAECFKKLKSFIEDEEVKAVVITVPAKFNISQIEAVEKAGKLSGFVQIELIQESIAAATILGNTSKVENGYFLVFDFQFEFNVTLCKSLNSFVSIVDTDGNNWLGQKSIFEAIVDEIIIPFLKVNYAIDSLFQNEEKKAALRSSLLFYAEEAISQLQTQETYCILSNIGDLPFEDDNGKEPEIDLMVTQKDMENVVTPIFQKAIDITKDLLRRNNLKGSDLGTMIFVGGPTCSPILRRMLKEQITDKVDTSFDPMTVVVKGAALFASTISISDEIKESTSDKTKLQLDIKNEATTVELDEMVILKLLKEKTIGTFPEKIYAEVVRFDGAWSSGKKLIGEKATIIDVPLIEGLSNSFDVIVYNEVGNKMECQPNQFSIIQGVSGLDLVQVLPYNIGIAKYFEAEGKELFMTIKGLEKNKRLPAIGVINGFKTLYDLRPGISSDIIRIPIYQGDFNADGTNPVLNNLITEVILTGENIPAFLPEGSIFDLTIKVDSSQLMTFLLYIPYLNHTEELRMDFEQVEILSTVDDLKGELILFYSNNPSMGKERFRFLLGELIRIEKNIMQEDEKLKIADSVKKEIRKWT